MYLFFSPSLSLVALRTLEMETNTTLDHNNSRLQNAFIYNSSLSFYSAKQNNFFLQQSLARVNQFCTYTCDLYNGSSFSSIRSWQKHINFTQ